MIVTDRWDGSAAPFQGDRRLRLVALPAGARVARAVVRVEPARGEGVDAFVERLSFTPGAAPGTAAAQVRQAAAAPAPAWTEVDLGGRRTLHAVQGRDLGGAALHVDLGGGVFVPVDAAGGVAAAGAAPFTFPAAAGAAAPLRLPGVAGTRLRLVRAAGDAPELEAVFVRGSPSGVTLRLGDDAPFFIHPGELTAPAETPDFAPVLARWLAAHGRAALGATPLPLTVRTETLGRLRVTVEVELALEAPLLPPPVAEATFPFDVSTHSVRPPGTPAWAGDLSVRLPAGARARAGGTRMRLRGAFAETRVAPGRGPTGVVDPQEARGRALVSPDYAQAQQVPSGAEALIAGVDLLLRPLSRTAEIQVELRRDEGGRPDRPLLARPVRVSVAQGAAAEVPVWVSAALPEPFHVDAETPYWIVLQAVAGEAEWVGYPHDCDAARRLRLTGSGTPAPVMPPLMNTVDGGASWRSGGPILALFRLRALPPRFTVPVAVEAGSGAEAVRVGLDAFAPLARVDFTLADAALAQAVSAAARGAARRCPVGEALADGRFARWHAEGEGVGEPADVGTAGARALRLAAAPDGRWVYVLAAREAAPVLLRIDVPADVVMDETRLPGPLVPESAACALLVHPDGTRAFALVQRPDSSALVLHAVDLETAALLGAPREIVLEPLASTAEPPPPLSAALSPDGTMLFVARGGRVASIGLPGMEEGGAGEALRPAVAAVEGIATSLAAVPGGRLCVGTDAGTGRLYLFDVEEGGTPRLAGEPFALPAVPAAVVVTADGAQALVAHRRARLPGSGAVVVDLESGATFPVAAKAGVDAVAAAPAPDGRSVYVGGGGMLGRVDAARRTMASWAWTPGDFLELAPTPQGDRVFALQRVDAPSATAVRAASVGTRRPLRWSATGPVAIGAPRGERPRGVVLGTPGAPGPDPALLAQTVDVREGCRYVFSFDGVASRRSAAVAELFWMGPRGELLDPHRLPLAEGDAFDALPAAEGRPLRPHRRWLVAPPGATRVEVRFRVPSGAAEVAGASLLATADPVVNGDFRLPLLGDDGGWEVLPQPRAAAVRADGAGGAVVRAVGPGPAELAQEVALEDDAPLVLRFEGTAAVPADGRPPEIRVRWMQADGRETGTAAVHPVLPDDFPVHALRVEPPAGAARAVLSLLVPARATLHARGLSAVPEPAVDVPIRFIAEAPGELTVADAWIAYDPPAAAGTGPVSASGEDGAGESGGAANGQGHGTSAGRGGADDDCAPCGPASRGADAAPASHAAATQARMRTVALAPAPVMPGMRWVAAGTLSPVAPQPVPVPQPAPARETITPVSDVHGVGVIRERRLASAGILTAEKLAVAEPEALIAADQALSPTVARALIEEAKRLVQARSQG